MINWDWIFCVLTANLVPRKIGIDSMHGERGTEPLMNLTNAKLNVNFIKKLEAWLGVYKTVWKNVW